MSQTTNQAGLQLIASFEGLRLNSCQDSVGVWTIGYGPYARREAWSDDDTATDPGTPEKGFAIGFD